MKRVYWILITMMVIMVVYVSFYHFISKQDVSTENIILENSYINSG